MHDSKRWNAKRIRLVKRNQNLSWDKNEILLKWSGSLECKYFIIIYKKKKRVNLLN